MWVVKCDTCCEMFHPPRHTGNDILEIREQAHAAGWTGPMDRFPASFQRPPDQCPTCTDEAEKFKNRNKE